MPDNLAGRRTFDILPPRRKEERGKGNCLNCLPPPRREFLRGMRGGFEAGYIYVYAMGCRSCVQVGVLPFQENETTHV